MSIGIKKFVVLEIGDHSLSLVVGEGSSNSIERIIGFKSIETQSICNGEIINVADVSKALSTIILELEREVNLTITQIVIGIGGFRLRTIQKRVKLDLSAKSKFCTGDVTSLRQFGKDNVAPTGKHIFYSNDIDFIIDGKRIVSDPIDLAGETIVGMFNFTVGPREYLERVVAVIGGTNRTIVSVIPSSIFIGNSILDFSDKMNRSLIIDFGMDHTSITYTQKGRLIYSSISPFGQNDIIADIMSVVEIDRATALNLFKQFGSAFRLADDVRKRIQIRVGKGVPPIEIRTLKIADIIEARLRETLAIFSKTLERQYEYIPNDISIYIAGEGSNIKGLALLAEDIFGAPAKVASVRRDLFGETSQDIIDRCPLLALSISLEVCSNSRLFTNMAEEKYVESSTDNDMVIELDLEPEQESSDSIEPESSDSIEPESSDSIEPESSDSIEPESSDSIEPELSDSIEPESSDSIEPESSDSIEPESIDNSRLESDNSVDAKRKSKIATKGAKSQKKRGGKSGSSFVGGIWDTLIKDGTQEESEDKIEDIEADIEAERKVNSRKAPKRSLKDRFVDYLIPTDNVDEGVDDDDVDDEEFDESSVDKGYSEEDIDRDIDDNYSDRESSINSSDSYSEGESEGDISEGVYSKEVYSRDNELFEDRDDDSSEDNSRVDETSSRDSKPTLLDKIPHSGELKKSASKMFNLFVDDDK